MQLEVDQISALASVLAPNDNDNEFMTFGRYSDLAEWEFELPVWLSDLAFFRPKPKVETTAAKCET